VADLALENVILYTAVRSAARFARSKQGDEMKAIWNDEVLADSNETIVVEGNHYFPPASLNMEFLIFLDISDNNISKIPSKILKRASTPQKLNTS
jgi:hypothetical protein